MDKGLPWVEKYRPKVLDEIIQHDYIIEALKKMVVSGDLPNLLFFGPPGSGKTSTAITLATSLFGNEYKDRVMNLNASDDRGINIVRNKIIVFAKTSVNFINKENKLSNFKLIILDEADSMTDEAQSALKKVMEDSTNITRFCFICNYINKILYPIISRCTTFNFKAIDKEIINNKLKDICLKENIKVPNLCLNKISTHSHGDLRNAIIILQNFNYMLDYFKYKKKKLTYVDILNFFGKFINKEKNLIEIIKNKNLKELSKYTTEIIIYGSSESFISELERQIINDKDLNDKLKAKIIRKIINCKKRILEGCNEKIQIFSLLVSIIKIIKFYNC